MSQNYVTNTPPGSTSGPTLATQIDARSDALLTSHSGAARPSYAKEGTLWLKNDGDPRELYFYDGSTDVLIAQVTSGGEVTFALGDELNGIAGLTVAVNRILYKNGAGNWDQAAITAFARTLIAAADAASARAALDASQSPIDENDFASDSATRPPTQRSTRAFVEAAVSEAGLGGGQTWRDVSGSRAANTSYQNTTGRPIVASLTINIPSGNERFFQISSDGSTWIDVKWGNGSSHLNLDLIVPDGWYYRMNGTGTVRAWAELRDD